MKNEINKEIISATQAAVIHLLIDYFEEQNIEYRFTGGLSGNLFGSTWKLQDIDIETNFKNLNRIEERFKSFVLTPVHRYIDDEFDIWLLQLRINDVDVDINAVEDFFIKPNFRVESKIENAISVFFQNRIIKTQSLEDIIEYKKLLGRYKDLEELIELKSRMK